MSRRAKKEQNDLLTGRTNYSMVRGSSYKKAKVVKGRYLPFQHHTVTEFLTTQSNFNHANITVIPLLDMSVLNQLYSPRYMQKLDAAYSPGGAAAGWQVGPTLHNLLRLTNLPNGGSFTTLFNVGSNLGSTNNTDATVGDVSTIAASGGVFLDSVVGGGALDTPLNRKIYLRGVFLKGQMKSTVTIKSNSPHNIKIKVWEIATKEDGYLGSDATFTWYRDMVNEQLGLSAQSMFSEKDMSNFTQVGNILVPTTAIPADTLNTAGDWMYKPEFSPEQLRSDTTFAHFFHMYNQRYVTLAPGQEITLNLKNRDWSFNLGKFHQRMATQNINFPAYTLVGGVITPPSQQEVSDFMAGFYVRGLNYGVMVRQIGTMGSATVEDLSVAGIDDSTLTYQVNRHFSWSLKGDDAVAHPTKGVIPLGGDNLDYNSIVPINPGASNEVVP